MDTLPLFLDTAKYSTLGGARFRCSEAGVTMLREEEGASTSITNTSDDLAAGWLPASVAMVLLDAELELRRAFFVHGGGVTVSDSSSDESRTMTSEEAFRFPAYSLELIPSRSTTVFFALRLAFVELRGAGPDAAAIFLSSCDSVASF